LGNDSYRVTPYNFPRDSDISDGITGFETSLALAAEVSKVILQNPFAITFVSHCLIHVFANNGNLIGSKLNLLAVIKHVDLICVQLELSKLDLASETSRVYGELWV